MLDSRNRIFLTYTVFLFPFFLQFDVGLFRFDSLRFGLFRAFLLEARPLVAPLFSAQVPKVAARGS
jgi:hypothetical protein